jgi:broad specificity phosphatase PhoE
MTTVFVVRHPETTWNVTKRYQGRLDTPLSPQGEKQATRTVEVFRDASLDAVFTSPLLRARGLATHIAEASGAELHVDQRLTEMAQGPWEGLYLDEIHRDHQALYHQWYDQPDRVTFPGGESLSDVHARAEPVLRVAFERYVNGRVLLVSHSVVIQVIALAALSLEPRHLHRIRVANCGVTTLCGDSAPGTMLSLNSTDALYGSPVASADAVGSSILEPRRTTT